MAQYLQEKIRSLVHRPPMPVIAAEAADLMADHATTLGSLADLLSKDRELATRIVRLANSPFIGYPRRIKTLEDAFLVLGTESLPYIITSMAWLMSAADHKPKDLDHRSLWDHSIAVGCAARKYAADAGFDSPGEAFVAGLLHDAGIFIEERYFPTEFHLAVGELRKHARDYCAVEKDIFGTTHAEIGSWVAEGWGYREYITEAVRCHDDPARAEYRPELASVVHFADVLCTRLHIGCFEFDSLTTFSPDALHMLNFENEPAAEKHLAELARSFQPEAAAV